MTENPSSEDSLKDEFHNLGKNLAGMLRSIWESPERKKFQAEIEEGLTDIGTTVNREVKTFSENQTAQRLRADVEDIAERLRTGEAEAKVRQELLTALRMVNNELDKFSSRWTSDVKEPPPNEPEPPEPPTEEQDVHPDQI